MSYQKMTNRRAVRVAAGGILVLSAFSSFACGSDAMDPESADWASGEVGEGSEEASEGAPTEEVRTVSNALTLSQSYPADPFRLWYAVVKDQLYFDFRHVRIHNNGGPGREKCEAKACVTFGTTTQCATAGPSYVRDATNISFSNDVVLQVERTPGACFTLNLEAKSTSGYDNVARASTKYCWDTGAREWRREGTGPGINRDESIYKKGNGEFDVTWNWHIDWEYTTVSGRLDQRSSYSDESSDGTQWHHLPPIPAAWADGAAALTAELDALDGDPDLYASHAQQPDPYSFDCRPFAGTAADEFCEIPVSTPVGPYFSVRNYRTDKTATYGLLVKPAPVP